MATLKGLTERVMPLVLSIAGLVMMPVLSGCTTPPANVLTIHYGSSGQELTIHPETVRCSESEVTGNALKRPVGGFMFYVDTTQGGGTVWGSETELVHFDTDETISFQRSEDALRLNAIRGTATVSSTNEDAVRDSINPDDIVIGGSTAFPATLSGQLQCDKETDTRSGRSR